MRQSMVCRANHRRLPTILVLRQAGAIRHKSPTDHAKNMVWILTESNLSNQWDEGHVRDFRGSWTHIGIGWKEGIFIVDYGDKNV
jgi:hypothetical protein